MIFSKFKYKISPRALCGITMRSLKNYQCTNPLTPQQPIASNQSNLPKASPDGGQTKDTIRRGVK